MRLDVRSILKTTVLGMGIAVLGGLIFRFSLVARLEAIFNVAIGCVVGLLFGRITIRHGGPDGFSQMALGGCLSAILPVVLAWTISMGIGMPDAGVFDLALNPPGLFMAIAFGTLTGAVTGAMGGLIYASLF